MFYQLARVRRSMVRHRSARAARRELVSGDFDAMGRPATRLSREPAASAARSDPRQDTTGRVAQRRVKPADIRDLQRVAGLRPQYLWQDRWALRSKEDVLLRKLSRSSISAGAG